MSERETVIPPLGMVTSPNKFGKTSSGYYTTPTMALGALRQADHCYMRVPGTVENAAWFASKSPSLTIDTTTACYVVPVKDTKWAIVFSYNAGSARWIYAWVDTNANSILGGSAIDLRNILGFQTLSSTGRFNTTTTRNRIVFNAANGVHILDDLNPANTTAGTARICGLSPPVLTTGTFSAVATGGSIADKKFCHVTAITRRRFSDGYEIASAPASCIKEANLAFGSPAVLQHLAFVCDEYLAGDVIEFYRTRAQDYTGTSGTNTGSEYFRSVSHILTSAEIAAGFCTVDDGTPDTNLGEALYTNSGQSTAASAIFPPPTCKVIATFKGYTFYLNRTDPPSYTFRIPVFWGFMGQGTGGAGGEPPYNRQYGIGTRDVKGNTTSGSNVITGVTAADLVGIKLNQKQAASSAGTFPANAVVTAIGASTITMSQNATATLVNTVVSIVDTIEIDATVYEAHSAEFVGGTSGAYDGDLVMILLDRVIPSAVTVSNGETVPAAETVLTRYRLRDGVGNMTLRATNGANYVPALPRYELNETARTFATTSVPNGFSWSEQNQPENVPLANTGFAGSGDIYAAYSTRDALWIASSDGLWRLSGTGGSVGAEGYDWRVDPVDSSLSLSGPQAGCVLRDTPYLYTNRGLVRVESSGDITELSTGRLDDLLPGPPWTEPTFTASNAIYVLADQENFEIWFREPTRTLNRLWIYNTNTDRFTNTDLDVTGSFSSGNPTGHGCYSAFFKCALVIDTTAKVLKAPTDTTSAPRYAQVKFQPVYGDDPMAMYMWQTLNVLLDSTAHSSPIAVIAYANGDGEANGLLFMNTSVAGPPSLSAMDSSYYRIGASIPRNAPAIANSIAVKLYFASYAAGASTKLLGISYDVMQVSDQRNVR